MESHESRDGAQDPTQPPAEASTAGDVRRKYFEATRDEHTFEALRVARQIAEAITDDLEAELPEGERKAFRRKSLGGRLERLESAIRDGEIALEREVIAGLRTLQAYGNYAVHFQRGAHSPPPRAVASAMASLALVAHWYFLKRAGESTPQANSDSGVELRLPAPGKPTFWQRWTLRGRLGGRRAPEFSIGSDENDSVNPSDSPQAQLAGLLRFYERSISFCGRVAASVIERESTAAMEDMQFNDLVRNLDVVSTARPARVPSSVVSDLEELRARRAAVVSALREQNADAEPFIEDAQRRNIAKDLATWYSRQYLSSSTVERGWKRGVAWTAGLGFVAWMFHACGYTDGREELRNELLQFCDEQSPPTPLCRRLVAGQKAARPR